MSQAIRPRRSILYMPGSNPRAMEKARTLPADGLILDLEDSVAPDAKAAARDSVVAAVKAGGFGAREVIVRINGLDTPWGADDLSAAVAAGPDAVLAPKISTPADVEAVSSRLAAAGAPASLALWAMMETPLGILNAGAIAAKGAEPGQRLACFVMGTNDLAKATGAALGGGRPGMLAWLSTALVAARAYGQDVIDGVFNDIKDEAGLAAECAQGRALGMNGKTLIHPSQLEPCNRAFSPSEAEVAAARRIIALFEAPENRGKGAVALDGRMVERLHAEIAARTLALADAIAGR